MSATPRRVLAWYLLAVQHRVCLLCRLWVVALYSSDASGYKRAWTGEARGLCAYWGLSTARGVSPLVFLFLAGAGKQSVYVRCTATFRAAVWAHAPAGCVCQGVGQCSQVSLFRVRWLAGDFGRHARLLTHVPWLIFKARVVSQASCAVHTQSQEQCVQFNAPEGLPYSIA